MLAYEGEHCFFNTVAKTGYLDVSVDYDVAVGIEPRCEHVSDDDAARKYGQAFGNAHVAMYDAANDCRPGHERGIAPGTFTDYDLARSPDGTAEVAIDADKAFNDEVTAKRTGGAEECIDEDIAGGGHASMVPGDR